MLSFARAGSSEARMNPESLYPGGANGSVAGSVQGVRHPLETATFSGAAVGFGSIPFLVASGHVELFGC